MKTQIVYSPKHKLHCIVRVVPKKQTEWNWSSSSDYYPHLNKLLSCKNAGQLLQTINELPSLLPGTGSVIYSFIETIAKLTPKIEQCKLELLDAEMYLDSPTIMRGNVASTKTFIRKWGGDSKSVIESLQYANPDECVVLVEFLQDWIFIRNALSVCTRLLGQLDNNNSISLADAGFEQYTNRRMKNMKLFGIALRHNFMIPESLFYNTIKRAREDSSIFSYKVPIDFLNTTDKSVFFTTEPIATNKPYSLRKSLKDQQAEKNTLFLGIVNTGDPEQMIKNIVSQFAAVFRNLEIKQKGVSGSERKFGWVYDESGEFENLAQPKMMPRSLASALWLQLMYHPSRRITLCKKCGNAVLSKEQGAPREFCSDSCRVQFGNESRDKRSGDKYSGGQNDRHC